MALKKILLIFGTRPEVIKLAPIFHELKRRADTFEVKVLVTAQHRDMLDQSLKIFSMTPDYDLNIMRDNQDLFDVTIDALSGIKPVLDSYEPDYVIVQGDTTSTFIGALAAFYRRIPVAHVEAGLRTHQKYSPFPEEVNRKLSGAIANLHFAPTDQSAQNLLAENVPADDVIVTGNTSIDAIQWVLQNRQPDFSSILSDTVCEAINGRFILLTSHRRESFGEPMMRTFSAIIEIAEKFPDVSIIFPVHPNPNVRKQAEGMLSSQDNIYLIEPMDYVNFSHLMSKAEILVTDSGGVQEEGPSLKKPILVLRETTERPEGIEAGTAKLVGTDQHKIMDEITRLLNDKQYYEQMVANENPYGDGNAATKIIDVLAARLGV